MGHQKMAFFTTQSFYENSSLQEWSEAKTVVFLQASDGK